MGSDDWESREAASERLSKIGEPALPALARAEAHADAEVRWRARRITLAIYKQEAWRRRLRLLSISDKDEKKARRASRINAGLYLKERGYYSGVTQAIPFFRHEFDRKRDEATLTIWPLATRAKSEKNEFTLYTIPLYYLKMREEPRQVAFFSLPAIYTYSEQREETRFWLPPLLSGFTTSPRHRTVSIFPLLYHEIDRVGDEEVLYVWPLLAKFKRRGDRFSVGLLFSLLFEYTYDPDWQEIRVLSFLRFRWGERMQPIIP